MTDDRDKNSRELDELREAVLDDWVMATNRVGSLLAAMERSVSWRVTRPLRSFRRLSYRAQEIGYVPTARLAAVALARRLGERR